MVAQSEAIECFSVLGRVNGYSASDFARAQPGRDWAGERLECVVSRDVRDKVCEGDDDVAGWNAMKNALRRRDSLGSWWLRLKWGRRAA